MKALLCLISLIAMPALAAPPAGFDARVEALRQQIGVPGMAITIVEDGKTVLARGYGVRKLGAPDKVDADTIFMTGSTGKAFTTAALATLADAGKISWDDKVADRLPGFEMYDPWVTREMTIRDLLVHRSGLGLGEGDMLFVPRTNIPRAEAVRRLRYLKPATSFRSGFAYDNVLYMVAGQLIEAVTGQRWEDYVRAHILLPAGMTDSTTENVRRFADSDRAYPHARTSQAVRGAGPLGLLDERDTLGDSAAPAGGLAISARDMAKWLTLQLAHGQLPGGGRLFSEAAHDEMWKPEILQPIDPLPDALEATQPMFNTYAFGWEVRDYHGARIVWHEGAVLGFESVVVLLPEKKCWLRGRDQQRGRRDPVRADVRAARSLPWAPRQRLACKVRGIQAGPAGCRRRCVGSQGGVARASRAVAVARGLCRHLYRPVVRPDQSDKGRDGACCRLPLDAADERPARALAI